MLYNSQEEAIAENYFTFVNDVAGILTITLGTTALKFTHPEIFAWFFLAILVAWVSNKGKEYKKISERYLREYKGFGILSLFWRMNIMIIGIAYITGIALGHITEAKIYVFFGL